MNTPTDEQHLPYVVKLVTQLLAGRKTPFIVRDCGCRDATVDSLDQKHVDAVSALMVQYGLKAINSYDNSTTRRYRIQKAIYRTARQEAERFVREIDGQRHSHLLPNPELITWLLLLINSEEMRNPRAFSERTVNERFKGEDVDGVTHNLELILRGTPDFLDWPERARQIITGANLLYGLQVGGR